MSVYLDRILIGTVYDLEVFNFCFLCFLFVVFHQLVFVSYTFLVSEEKFLHQILLEEQFGPVQKFGEEEKKKMLAPKKAAIGFTYDDSVPSSSTAVSISHNIPLIPPEATEEEESDSDIDLGNNSRIQSNFRNFSMKGRSSQICQLM